MPGYYYLAASLPFLKDSDQASPMTDGEFMDMCLGLVGEKDYRSLLSARLEPGADSMSTVVRGFRDWEISLRNALVVLRTGAQGAEKEAGEYLKEGDPVIGTEQVALQAFNMASPLAAELFLDRQRWLVIDELAGIDEFDIEAICAYRLKLLILERHAEFDAERGLAVYNSLYSQILSASGQLEQGWR